MTFTDANLDDFLLPDAHTMREFSFFDDEQMFEEHAYNDNMPEPLEQDERWMEKASEHFMIT